MYPRINVDLEKIRKNVKTIKNICKDNNLKMGVVTKVFCADRTITNAVIEEDVDFLADSRIENLESLKDYGIEKWLLRIPMKSEVKELVKYSNLSLNSELETIKLIQEESKKQNRIHKIILLYINSRFLLTYKGGQVRTESNKFLLLLFLMYALCIFLSTSFI
ncbi:MAG: hypothetical protein H0S78_12185 [Tissierellales bacterium]|nr:hypothetical protein [Tissierellales bacterium]